MQPKWLTLWRNLRHRRRVERDLDDELEAMRDLLAQEKIAAGVTPADARRAAATELGNIEAIKEDVRDVRAGVRIETTIKDIRYAVRVLGRNPLFALTAALSLAIGIGATTTVFSVANGLLMRSVVGVADPDRLVDIVVTESGSPGVTPITYADYLELRRRADTVESVYGYELDVVPAGLRVGDSGAERVFVNVVTPNYFSALGVGAAAGRTFGAGDGEDSGAAPIIVLSHRFWARRFNGNASVVGQSVRLNGHPMTVVGVAAEGFRGTGVVAPDAWVPTSMVAVVYPGRASNPLSGFDPWLMVGGRLKPGVTRAHASSQIRALGEALRIERPRSTASLPPGAHERAAESFQWSAEVASPIPYGLRLIAAGFVALLMAIVLVVLVIACANVAGVMLARATARSREMAMRAALGASRARIIRQLLTETVVLFGLGGLGGLMLAQLNTSLLASRLPGFSVPVSLSTPIDGRVVAFALALTGIAALVSGLAPALQASRADVMSALKDDGQAHTERTRLRNGFVVVQIAFSTVLIITAGLFVTSLDAIATVDRGFDAENVDTVSLDLSTAGYTESTGPVFLKEVLERVRTLPGITAATVADRAPGPGGRALGWLTVPGFIPVDARAPLFRNWSFVEPGFFSTLRIPLLAGRDFSDSDRKGTQPVAIVCAAAAKRFWPDGNAVGQSVILHSVNGQSTRILVVGVVGELKFGGRGDPRLDVYMPLGQRYSREVTLLARTSSSASNAETLRTLISSIDPNLPVLRAETLARLQSGPVEAQLRIAATVAGSIGIIGLVLAAMGVYGVTAYVVTRRTREIAIRVSLGAARTTVVALALRQGLILVAIGSAIGLVLGIAVGRLLAASPLGLRSWDPVAFVGATVLLFAAGAFACLVPVLRASRINPMEALRCE